MEPTNLTFQWQSGVLTAHIAGEIDHHSARPLREAIDRELIRRRPRLFVLSLGQVSFMDSSGLGLMLGRFTRMQELGGRMKVADPTPEIEKILRLAGFEKKIPIESTRKGGVCP